MQDDFCVTPDPVVVPSPPVQHEESCILTSSEPPCVCVCVCVCVCERERERERESVCGCVCVCDSPKHSEVDTTVNCCETHHMVNSI